MADRYWKRIGNDPSQVYRVYRLRDRSDMTKYENGQWIDAHDWYERVLQDPDYVEIEEVEALELLSRF